MFPCDRFSSLIWRNSSNEKRRVPDEVNFAVLWLCLGSGSVFDKATDTGVRESSTGTAPLLEVVEEILSISKIWKFIL